MRTGKWSAAAAVGVLVAVVVAISTAAEATNVFAGRWSTSAGGSAGGADFRVVSSSEGAQAVANLHGSPCAEPTTYYRVVYHDTGGTGTMAGCTVGGPSHFIGRYASDAGSGGGNVDIFYASSTFSGSYTYDDDPHSGTLYDYSGTFVSHFTGDGCCPEPVTTTATTPTTTATTTTTPPPVVDNVVPKSGKTTTYPAPEPGGVGGYRTPKLGPKAKSESVELNFIDKDGNPVPPPEILAVISNKDAETAIRVCSIFIYEKFDDRSYGPSYPNFSACLDVVTQILVRAAQIKQAQGGRRAARASTVCTRVTRTSTTIGYVTSCARTATGVRVTIRTRSSRQKLRSVLKGTPRLAVGRSSLDTTPGVQMKVLWKTSSKR